MVLPLEKICPNDIFMIFVTTVDHREMMYKALLIQSLRLVCYTGAWPLPVVF